MRFKKKTIIWEDNNEPPKNYIWMRPDSKAYEYNYTTRKWEESNLIATKENVTDQFIQECIDSIINFLKREDPKIQNLDDVKKFIEESDTFVLDSLLIPANAIQSMLAGLPESTTVTITGDDDIYAYLMKNFILDESSGIPTSIELISVNEQHYNELLALLTDKEEQTPTPTYTTFYENDLPITVELRYANISDIYEDLAYDINSIDYLDERLPIGTEDGTYYCLYGFWYYDRNNFLENHSLTLVEDITSIEGLEHYEFYQQNLNNNNYEQNLFLENREIYKINGVKYNNHDVYLIKITPHVSSLTSDPVYIVFKYKVYN